MWRDKTVLDFGGNIGNMLRDPNSTIEERNYWCIDVVQEAIQKGRESFPHGHWIHYDRYNYSFNPTGLRDKPLPELDQRFDYIVAYSVFTNMPRREMLVLVPALVRLLKPNGVLAFTFIDPHYHSWPGGDGGDNLRWRLDRIRSEGKAIDSQALATQAENAQWCTLVNGEHLSVDAEGTVEGPATGESAYHAFYSAAYMARLFPQSVISPPVNNEMQHCCLLRGPSA